MEEKRSGYCKADGVYYSAVPQRMVPFPPLDVCNYILSHSHHHPTSTALIDASTGASITFAELRNKVRALSLGIITRLGIGKGDVVMVIAPNSIHIPLLYLSILSTGAVLTTSNPLATPYEIKSLIGIAKPPLIFTLKSLANKFKDLTTPLFFIDDSASIQALWASKGDEGSHRVEIKPEDTGVYLYSSGTSGKCKAVELTHTNIVSTVANSPAETCKAVLCAMPLFHVYGFVYSLSCILRGSPVVILPRFELRAMFSTIETYGIDILPAAPPLLVSMAKSDVIVEFDLSSLKTILCGGAPLSKECVHDFSQKFSSTNVRQSYGATEAGTVTLTDSRAGSEGAGVLSPVLMARIVDLEKGNNLPPNYKGELWLKGANIMKGYLGGKEATTAAIDSDGWYKTGDLCYFDYEGVLFVVDRIKELIKYKGFQVAPAELEELLVAHPDIMDVAVIPCPDESAGEIPMAVVVTKEASNMRENDVMDFVAEKVSPYKRIRRVAFVQSIPKTPSGKIQRKRLAQELLCPSRM